MLKLTTATHRYASFFSRNDDHQIYEGRAELTHNSKGIRVWVNSKEPRLPHLELLGCGEKEVPEEVAERVYWENRTHYGWGGYRDMFGVDGEKWAEYAHCLLNAPEIQEALGTDWEALDQGVYHAV